METLKIRHILPPDGLRAIYAIPVEPYYRDIPCIERALVTRKYRTTETDTDESVIYDDTIGRIVNGRIIDADMPVDGSLFWCYTHEGRYAFEDYKLLIAGAISHGYRMALERSQYEPTTEYSSVGGGDRVSDGGDEIDPHPRTD